MSFLNKFSPGAGMNSLRETLKEIGFEKANIAHFCTGNLFGGIEVALVNFSKFASLIPQIQQSFICVFNGDLAVKLNEVGSDVHLLGPASFKNPIKTLQTKKKLQKLLEEKRFDVVIMHSMWSHAMFGKQIKKSGAKLILWNHGYPKRYSSFSDFIGPWVSPDFLVANSKFTAGGVAKIFKNKSVKVVYPFTELLSKEKTINNRSQVRKKMGVDGFKKIILINSRLEPSKGHELLFDCLACLGSDLDWECWIANQPQRGLERLLKSKLQKKAESLGIASRIRWLGPIEGGRDELISYYFAADVFCQPNLNPEAFGLVFVESQVCGCPVVTSALGGAVEAIDPEGFNILVSKSNPIEYSRALEKCFRSNTNSQIIN